MAYAWVNSTLDLYYERYEELPNRITRRVISPHTIYTELNWRHDQELRRLEVGRISVLY